MVGVRVRRSIAVCAALLLVPVLSGCVAAQTVGHVRGASEGSAALAVALRRLPGVERASVRYDPADLHGESVHVGAELAPSASAEDWVAAVAVVQGALGAGELASVRPEVRLHSSGQDGATIEAGGTGAGLPEAADLQERLRRWGALRTMSGVPLRFERTASNGGVTWYRIRSESAARRFVDRLGAMAPLLADTSVVGPGFSGSGPAPAGTRRLYRLVVKNHVPGRPWAPDPPAQEVASVTWGPGSVQVMTFTPSASIRWSADDLALAAAVAARPARVRTMFSWQNLGTAAVFTVGGCGRGAPVAQPDDRRLVAAVSAAARRLPRTVVAGACAD